MAWRELPRSTRVVFWSGLLAAAIALSLFVLLMVAASRIG
jgi:hypothetical protein